MPKFKIPRRNAEITFEEGHLYHGAVIECRLDVPMSLYLEMLEGSEDRKKADALNRKWAEEVVISWNFEEDDGSEIPANGDGLVSLPPAVVNEIVTRWVEEVGKLPGPLDSKSRSAGS